MDSILFGNRLDVRLCRVTLMAGQTVAWVLLIWLDQLVVTGHFGDDGRRANRRPLPSPPTIASANKTNRQAVHHQLKWSG